jgi:hypothetical protein
MICRAMLSIVITVATWTIAVGPAFSDDDDQPHMQAALEMPRTKHLVTQKRTGTGLNSSFRGGVSHASTNNVVAAQPNNSMHNVQHSGGRR